MIYRCILPEWAKVKNLSLPNAVEGEFTPEELNALNMQGYNIYFFPNYPSIYDSTTTVKGSQIDVFNFVFVDMDLKQGLYIDKQTFITELANSSIPPTFMVDSGNGVHAYWHMSDLDAKSYLRLQRRLFKKFKTDEAVAKLAQLMRMPDSFNTKKGETEFKECKVIFDTAITYTCGQLDAALPPITHQDEEYCQRHYNSCHEIVDKNLKVDDKLPLKFAKLLHKSDEVKNLWCAETDDRSKSDYRLGHIMFANGFTEAEATSVLVNTAKALTRSSYHRVSYAKNIVDKIWTYELGANSEKLDLSNTVKEILQKHGDALKGTRLPCWRYLDATAHGFRLGQVIGLVAGSGVGKTAMALNMFAGFVQNNPDYEHFFIPLEQPVNEIADRWKTMCGDNTNLYEKVHVISNYADDGSFRHLSFAEIKEYIVKFQQVTGKKVGCIVIDHIGALKKQGKDGENQDLMTICHEMKAFAIQTNTLLVMQSQSSREKAGIGDLELNKDAAYGTVYFESYCDYLITIWQPLKRCYSDPKCPTVTAFKFCKIRHKKKGIDSIEEDVCYRLYFESKTEHLRELTQDEEKSFDYFNTNATNKRKQDRKTDVVPYKSMPWLKGANNGKDSTNKNISRT